MSQQTPTNSFRSIVSKYQVDGAWVVTVVENDVIVTTQSFPTEDAADKFVLLRQKRAGASEATVADPKAQDDPGSIRDGGSVPPPL